MVGEFIEPLSNHTSTSSVTMKKIIILSIINLFFLTQQSVAQETKLSKDYDKVGKFQNGVAIVQKNKLVGAIDENGKEVIPVEYERLSGFGGDGISYSRKKKKVGLITKEGKVLVENKYDFIGSIKNKKAVVKLDGLCGVINTTNGKVVVELKYKKLVIGDDGMVTATNTDDTVTLLKIK